MKKVRQFLLGLPIAWIVLLALLIFFGKYYPSNTTIESIFEKFITIEFLITITTAILSFKYARHLGRDPLAWATIGFFLPFLAPFILAFLKEFKVNPAKMKGRLKLDGTNLTLKIDTLNKNSIKLDNLWLVTLIVPVAFDWKLGFTSFFTSESTDSYLDLDLLTEHEYSGHFKYFSTLWDTLEGKDGKKLTDRDKLTVLDTMKICLSDYDYNYVVITLKDILLCKGGNFWSTLTQYRKQRQKKLHKWLDNNPVVGLKGRLWGKIFLSKEGIMQKKKIVPWAKIERIQTNNPDDKTYLNFIPKGHWEPSEVIDSISIPKGKEILYCAECFFFKNISATQENYTLASSYMENIFVCTKCNKLVEVQNQEKSKCCNAPVIGFIKTKDGEFCSFCGSKFSDSPQSLENTINEIASEKGFYCNKCKKNICFNCVPKNSDGELTFLCQCNGSLQMRM